MPVTIVVGADSVDQLIFDGRQQRVGTDNRSDYFGVMCAHIKKVVAKKRIASRLDSPVLESRCLTESEQLLAERKGIWRQKGRAGSAQWVPVTLDANGNCLDNAVAERRWNDQPDSAVNNRSENAVCVN